MNKVQVLQAEMAKLPQLELETRHYFAGGMYAREITQPKGSLVVGKLHKSEHFVIVTKGKLEVFDDGVGKAIYEAPCVIVSAPGAKRAILAHEDSVYMNVHRTDETDLDRIEEELIEPESLRLFDSQNRLLLKQGEH